MTAPTTRADIEAAAIAMASAHYRRDRLMAEARAEGATLRQIAEAAGMTASGVKKVLDRRGDTA